ncbi:expressed hypothetical protein [Trichoplax adhaerens]|uniref:Tetraspanin n=1 Tax=Trichoplax adhaerens TaxID=10228 RepID=B3RLW6_TRIAD|nr:expressed hypothetical protein [Trichoplax adhaerens]EDV29596.1 expressed hypothetical protein [Trichoplax adhaerens]|eukprot:XP_002108798.1 expressed hypothetical protein [Trichoplax adhaerens]
MADCGDLVRIILIVLNTIFFLCGGAMIGLAIYVLVVSGTTITTALGSSGLILPGVILLMVAGIVTFICSGFGCCGANKRKRWCLTSYLIILFVIIVLEIAGGVYAYVNRDLITTNLTSRLNSDLATYYNTPTTQTAFNTIQSGLSCCAVHNYTEWRGTSWYGNVSAVSTVTYPVPDSCCRSNVSDTASCGYTYSTTNNIYTTGCLAKLQTLASDNASILLGIGIGVGVVQILGFIFGVILCNSIKND